MKYVVAITFDKVQTFLYDAIHSELQDNQTNKKTLAHIIRSSEFISTTLYEKLGMTIGREGIFEIHKDDILLKCSGVCIFKVEIQEEELKNKLKELFQEYYCSYNGTLVMKYIYFEDKDELSEIETINRAKEELKSVKKFNEIIEENKDVLFQFQKVMELLPEDKKEEVNYENFVDNIDKLQFQGKNPKNDEEKKHRIAVIKADLDGMGNLFKNLTNFHEYKTISEILTDRISLRVLNMTVGKYNKKPEKNLKVFPLYMAGDDIFFAVHISDLCAGIEVCKQLLMDINREIKRSLGNDKRQPTLSIGIEITSNLEPIRYYYTRVEEQLSCAKKRSYKDGETPIIKLSLNGMVYCIYDQKGKFESNQEKKRRKDDWYIFLKEARIMKYMMEHEMISTRYFYTLLEKILDPNIRNDNQKYLNRILYHLLPEHCDEKGEKKRIEKLVVYRILKKLEYFFIKNRQLKFYRSQKELFQKYIQLLLLFTDERFQIAKALEDQEIEKQCNEIGKCDITIFLDYIYKSRLSDNKGENGNSKNREALHTIFIEKRDDEYITLPITTSMFHRMKNWGLDVEKCATMLESLLNHKIDDDNEGDKVNNENKVEEKVEVNEDKKPRKKFDKKEFIALAGDKDSSLWTKDYIDSLFVFYRWKEVRRKYGWGYKEGEDNKGKKKGKKNGKNKN